MQSVQFFGCSARIHHLSNPAVTDSLAIVVCFRKPRTDQDPIEQNGSKGKTEPSVLFRSIAAMLGALRRSAKETSKTLGRASQLQQQRFLNIHEYQVRHGQ